jgi:ABC-type Mn2+/Zn2+ transport system permease subunit
VVGGVTLLVGLVIFLAYKQLLFTTFDSEVAQVYGVRTEWVDTLFALRWPRRSSPRCRFWA